MNFSFKKVNLAVQTGGKSLINVIRRKYNPVWYQGAKTKHQHFEGWYYKIVDKNGRNALAIIPGIYIDRHDNESHAFIQIFDGRKNSSHYFKFPVADFIHKNNFFDIRNNHNHFSENQLKLELKDASFEIKGSLQCDHLTPWPKTWLAPGIMGWYSWAPFMECYHGVVSLDHNIEGSLSVNGGLIDFTGGRGYTEKDWGRSFPEAWIWMQSNHFSTNRVSLTGSIAIIPWIRRPFAGFIFGLWNKNKLYRFTTYTGAKIIKLEIDENKVHCQIKQKRLVLEIIAHRAEGGYLQAPTIKGMRHRISETMQSRLEVRLLEKSGRAVEVILDDTGKHAGFEIAGDTERLLQMIKHKYA